MSKFHVGDKVRIEAQGTYWQGKVGFVAREALSKDDWYYVTFDGKPAEFVFKEKELRPADIFAWLKEGAEGRTNLVENPSMVTSTEGWGSIQQAVDVVNHPAHYNRFPVEVINITEQLDFNRGNAVKYLARAGYKEGVDELEDLSKAAWYVNRAIEKLKKERENG